MKKDGRRSLEGLCMDRYNIPAGGFGHKVYFEGVDLMGLVHLKRITIQYPFDVLNIAYMMVHIDIAVTDRIRPFHLRILRSRKLLGFLGNRKIIEEMLNMLEHRLNPLRPSAF
jgi:hypothetical protein